MFQFKQFTIDQRDCAMKIGTDGILLGAWAEPRKPIRILDIGTGTGLLALMLAQRFPSANIDAIELEKAAAVRASANFQHSPWADRLRAEATALQHWQPDQPYDFLICNPPFFQSGIRSPKTARSLARHTDPLSFRELAIHSARLCGAESTFALILPVDEFDAFQMEMQAQHWYLGHRCAVQPLPHKLAHRYLLQYQRTQGPLKTTQLCIETEPGQYSAAYRTLTDAFYR